MIPKRIIYVWVGGKEKPEAVKKCIDSWRKHMPDWEYLEINEDNFDVNINEYCKKAYGSKHWAYVSDIARLWALYTYGGIYMDTDVFVYKPLDKFLIHNFFTGFEQAHYPITATMGANKGNELIKEMLDTYDTKIFETHENWYEYETNTMILSDVLSKYFDRDNMAYQENEKGAIYPKETFCNGDIDENTYARHLMLGGWSSE